MGLISLSYRFLINKRKEGIPAQANPEVVARTADTLYIMSNITQIVGKKGFPSGSMVKNLPANAGDAGLIPGSGRSPGERNGNHSNILAWEIPWTEKPGRL